MDTEELYQNIDQEEDMSDAEKRESYFTEVENDQAYEDWKDRGH